LDRIEPVGSYRTCYAKPPLSQEFQRQPSIARQRCKLSVGRNRNRGLDSRLAQPSAKRGFADSDHEEPVSRVSVRGPLAPKLNLSSLQTRTESPYLCCSTSSAIPNLTPLIQRLLLVLVALLLPCVVLACRRCCTAAGSTDAPRVVRRRVTSPIVPSQSQASIARAEYSTAGLWGSRKSGKRIRWATLLV
jgi:hypothetical protein